MTDPAPAPEWLRFFLDSWTDFELKNKEKTYEDLWVQQNVNLFKHITAAPGADETAVTPRPPADGRPTSSGSRHQAVVSNARALLEGLTKTMPPGPGAGDVTARAASAGVLAAATAAAATRNSLKQQFLDASSRDIAHDLATMRLAMIGPYPDIGSIGDLWTYVSALYRSTDAFADMADGGGRGSGGRGSRFSGASESVLGRFLDASRSASGDAEALRRVYESLSMSLSALSLVKRRDGRIFMPRAVKEVLEACPPLPARAASSPCEPELAVVLAQIDAERAALQRPRGDAPPGLGESDAALVAELVAAVEQKCARLRAGAAGGLVSPRDVVRDVQLEIKVKEAFWADFVKLYYAQQTETSMCLCELVERLDEFERSDQYDQYWYDADELYVDVTKVDFEKTVAAIYNNVKTRLNAPPADAESYLRVADQQVLSLIGEFEDHCHKVREGFLEPFIERNVERLRQLHGNIVTVFQKTLARFEAHRARTNGTGGASELAEAELEACLRIAEKHMQRFPVLILADDGQVWGQPHSLVRSFIKLEKDLAELERMYASASHSAAAIAAASAAPPDPRVPLPLETVRARLQFLDNSKFKRKLKTWGMMFISCVNEFPDLVAHVFETYRARKIFEPLLTFIGREMISSHDAMIADFRALIRSSSLVMLWEFLTLQTLDHFCFGFEQGLAAMVGGIQQQLAAGAVVVEDVPVPRRRSAAGTPLGPEPPGAAGVTLASGKKKKKKRKKATSVAPVVPAGEAAARPGPVTVDLKRVLGETALARIVHRLFHSGPLAAPPAPLQLSIPRSSELVGALERSRAALRGGDSGPSAESFLALLDTALGAGGKSVAGACSDEDGWILEAARRLRAGQAVC